MRQLRQLLLSQRRQVPSAVLIAAVTNRASARLAKRRLPAVRKGFARERFSTWPPLPLSSGIGPVHHHEDEQETCHDIDQD